MRRSLVALAITLIVAAAIATGCATMPSNTASAGGIILTMQDIVRMLAEEPCATAEGLHDRYPALKAVKAQVRDYDDHTVYGKIVCSWSAPTGSIGGIPAGKNVEVLVWAYNTDVEAQFGPDTLITTGQSAPVTIVAGTNVPASVVLVATLPVFSGLVPADGELMATDTPLTIGCDISDLGGGTPTAQIYVNSVAYGGLQVSNHPAVSYTPTGFQALGLSCVATTTSGGNDAVSWTAYATPFWGSVGYRTTYATDLTSGPLAGYHAEVDINCPPNNHIATVYWRFTRTLSDRYEADSQFNLATGQPIEPFTRVSYGGTDRANPNGSANLLLEGTTLKVTGLSFSADSVFVSDVNFDAPQSAQSPF